MSDGNLNWQFLVAMASIAVSMLIATMWLGSLSNQIFVNSKRLDILELKSDLGQKADADFAARIPLVEKRLEHLENWQNAVRQQQQR